MIALLIGFMVSLAGLAVDLVFAYSVKHYLGIAIDSVALSAMRGLATGSTYDEQADSITRISNLMLATNFPTGYLLSHEVRFEEPPTIYGATIPSDAPAPFARDTDLAPGMREVRVTGLVTIPTFFARAFGVTELTVRSSAVAARQDANVMLVLDRSGSLGAAGAWDDVQQAATTFLDFFDNNGDRVGLVSFGMAANVDVSLRSGFKDGNYAANQIALMESNGATNSAMGLWLAYGELLRINDPDSLNVIVFFTDGQPTAMPGRWRVHTTGSPRSGNSSNPTCNTTYKEAVIQTYGGPTNMAGFNRYIAGPPKVNPAPNWGADFYPVSGCSNLQTPYGENVGSCCTTRTACPRNGRPGTLPATAAITAAAPPTRRRSTSFRDRMAATVRATRTCSPHPRAAPAIAARSGAVGAQPAEDIAVTAEQTRRWARSRSQPGLGVAGLTANEEFLLRVANDKDSPTFNTSLRPEGEYIFAPTVAELAAAFDRVRSNVIRLTR